MYPSTELLSERRKKVPPHHRHFENTFRIFNLELPERNSILVNFQEENTPKRQEQRDLLEWRNTPQPTHVKCIKANNRFLNKPICFMEPEPEDVKDREACWWLHREPTVHHAKPSYDKQSTQRNDFQKPNCKLSRPVKYSSLLLPSHGIVPLSSPRMPTSLPRIFQEEISFNHQYNARATPCIRYQGRKQGTFVWTEITPAKGVSVPEGAKALTTTHGTGLLEQPQAKKGSSVENHMTSPCLYLPDSQETSDSNTRLSKTDISVGAKADPSASEKGPKSVEISQENEVDLSDPAGDVPSSPASKSSLQKSQEPLPLLLKAGKP